MNRGAQRFAKWLEHRDFTHRAAAKLLGCDVATCFRWAAGERLPTIPHAVKIAKVAGIAIEDWASPPDRRLLKKTEKNGRTSK